MVACLQLNGGMLHFECSAATVRHRHDIWLWLRLIWYAVGLSFLHVCMHRVCNSVDLLLWLLFEVPGACSLEVIS